MAPLNVHFPMTEKEQFSACAHRNKTYDDKKKYKVACC